MVPGDADLGRTLLRNSTEGYVRRTLRRMTQRVYREYQRQLWEPLLPTAEAAVSYATAAVDSTTLRFGATHPGRDARRRRGGAPRLRAGLVPRRVALPPVVRRRRGPLRLRHEARAPVQRRRLFDRGGSVGGARRRARRAGPAVRVRRVGHAVRRPVVRRRGRARGAGRSFLAHVAGAGRRAHAVGSCGKSYFVAFSSLLSTSPDSRLILHTDCFSGWRTGGRARRARAFLLSGGTPCALQTELALRGAGNATAAALRAAAPAPAGPAAAPAADPRVRPRDGFSQRPV